MGNVFSGYANSSEVATRPVKRDKLPEGDFGIAPSTLKSVNNFVEGRSSQVVEIRYLCYRELFNM